ncbi:hypothetical protein DRP05_06060 [Archaeoglobales archaeon]|nr:MAG: hypothetical protein DRP05_06060 [Archaeoglobales archaeon]
MKDEVKNVIYIVLDILDSLAKTYRETPDFIKVNENVLKDVKNELFELLKNNMQKKLLKTQ